MGNIIEGQFVSVSASDDLESNLLAAVAPIQLDDAKKQMYEDVFFSIRGGKDSKYSQDTLRDVVIESLHLGSDLNTFFAFVRRVLSYAHLYDDKSEPEVQSELLNLASEMKKNNIGVVGDVPTLFLQALRLFDSIDEDSQSNPFKKIPVDKRPSVLPIIKKSTRYKDGYDIIYAGKYGRGGTKISMEPFPSIESNPSSYNYNRLRDQNFSADISIRVMSAARRIMELVTSRSDNGKFTMETANKRRICQFPLDYAFESWNEEISRIMGFRLEFFRNLDPIVRPYKAFFSAVAIIEVPQEIINDWHYFVQRSRLANNNNTTIAENPRPDNTKLITEEAAFTPRVGSSVAINLELPYVKYITQDENADKVNYCLNTWVRQWTPAFLRPKNTRAGSASDQRKVARYIIPPSRLGSMSEARKKLGMHISESKTNEDGLVIMPKGVVSFMPLPEDASNENALEYERKYEDYLETIYSLGLTPGQPVHMEVNAALPDDPRLTAAGGQGDFLRAKKDEVEAYGGALLAFSWDYGTALYAQNSINSSGISQIQMNGCSAIDPLMIADFLGYDFKSSGQTSQSKHFITALKEFRYNMEATETLVSQDTLSTLRRMCPELNLPENMRNVEGIDLTKRVFLTKRMLRLFETYSYYSARGLTKSIVQLIEETKAEMNISMFSRDDTPLDFGLYDSMMSDSGGLGSLADRYPDGHGAIVLCLLLLALRDAAGNYSSNLFRMVSEEVGYSSAALEVKEHSAYFNVADPKTRMADFSNVYSYFGGRLFKNMCKAITKISKRDMLYPKRDASSIVKPPSFNYIAADVLPMAIIFSKYVPEYLDYFEKAEDIFDQYSSDDSIGIEDIIAPGIALNANGTKPSLFPHQVKANKFLRRAPKFAILDISPGGGKTTIGIIDILCLAEKHKTEPFMPVVVAPDRLCANWCEDTAKFTKGNWNTIPITRAVAKVWGYDLLYKIIKEAPRNTILVVGLNFLSRQNKFSVTYGAREVTINGSVEFIKQFNPAYVLLDESHKAKTFDRSGKTSGFHSAVKELTTMTGVKYIRLATGTLVHGILEDVVGQAALMSAYALKTPDSMDETLANMEREKLAGAIRTKLGKYCSLITLKRKEWAFMLPNPIDAFHKIQLFDEHLGLTTVGHRLHQEAYEHVMSEAKEIMMNGTVGDLGKVEEDDDESSPDFGEDDESSDDEESGGGVKGNAKIIGAGGEVDTRIMAMLDKKYFQRAEQMIVNPWGDNYFQQIAEQAGLKKGSFVPAPIQQTINCIDEHFVVVDHDPTKNQEGRVYKWKPNIAVKEFDVVEHEGVFYMRRPLPHVEGAEVSIKRRETPLSSVAPKNDPDNWKLESRGKILILCRYIGNTQAIYDALPVKYRTKARIFHGKIKKSIADDNIEQFKHSDDVQILIANEQAIAEGLNLQMASRIIRVDTPWSPGEYEQSTARIFRPDPAAAKRDVNGKVGDISREVIYIDWIMCEGTLQVGKIARLMWKTIDNVRFNEEGNPHYDPMRPYVLDKIVMGLDMLFVRCKMEDYYGDGMYENNYFGAKAALATLERQEFIEMRTTTRAEMIDMVIPDMPSDFKRLELLPTLPNQIIPDPEDFGLIKLPDFIKQNLEEILEDADGTLKGLPVKTGFGTGTIVGIQRGNRVEDPVTGEYVLNSDKPVTSVRIKYHGTNEALKDIPSVNMPIEMVYVATKLDGKRADQFFKPAPMSAAERKKMERAAREAERIAEEQRVQEEKRRRQQERRDREAAERQQRTDQRVVIRQGNRNNNKPVNEGIEVVTKLPPRVKPGVTVVPPKPQQQPTVKPKAKYTVKLIPTFYDGFLCIHATNNDPEVKRLKKFGFENFEDFVYMDFDNFYRFEGLLKWIEKQERLGNFEIDEDSVNRLVTVYDAFEREHIDPEQLFSYKQAKRAQNKVEQFFRAFKRKDRNRKLVRMYTIVMHDRLRVAIDLTTNPIANQIKGKLISAVGEKWKLHPGMHIYFAGGKRELVQKLQELEGSGYHIENRESLIEAIDELRLK